MAAPRIVALALFVAAGIAGSAGLALAARSAGARLVAGEVEDEADAVAARIAREIQLRLLALERMAERWRLADGTPREAWHADAANYLGHMGGIDAVEVVDADGRVAWVTPEAHGWVVGTNLRAEPARRRAMDAAWRGQRTVVTGPLRLHAGGVGVVSFRPLYRRDRFDGWLGGVFATERIVGSAVGDPEGWRLGITVDGVPLHADPRPASPFCAVRVLGAFYLGWRVEVCAAPERVAARLGELPAASFGIGMAFTLLASGLMGALMTASDRERRARALAARLGEQAVALERARRELAELSWSMSHELRAPLRAIDGYAALLAEAHGCAEHLARIRANAQRMANQLDGLIELLRVARAPVRPVDVNVTLLARGALARRAAEEPARAVERVVEDGIVVRGDAALVATIVEALVDNAWKFTRPRARAHIAVRAAPGGFCVEDDGVGFEPAFEQKLFDPFERLHAPGEFEGLGLGLAVAARAAARLGGRLRAEGSPGAGARFWLELPRDAAE